MFTQSMLSCLPRDLIILCSQIIFNWQVKTKHMVQSFLIIWNLITLCQTLIKILLDGTGKWQYCIQNCVWKIVTWNLIFYLSFSLSVENVLHYLEQQVGTTTEFKLCVDRGDLPDRGKLQWKRKKTASPASALKLVYGGETGIDTGQLRKEFVTGMLAI